MGQEPPGPTCGAKVGASWIDDGTRDRGRSSAPGPFRYFVSMVLGAAPAGPAPDDEKAATIAMLRNSINVLAESPFGRTQEGVQAVRLLRAMNDGTRIAWGDTIEGGRGDWDGRTIRMNGEFRGKSFATILELVHEVSHALWRQRHPRQGMTKDRQREDDIDDELHAQENQLAVYAFLRQTKGMEADAVMELRLQRKAGGTLRATIEQRFTP